MAARGRSTLARQLRRSGSRLHGGPWTAFLGEGERCLIVSLGRAAGPAVARSRVRRIARSVFADARRPTLDAPILLTARAFVGEAPRKALRAEFVKLRARVEQVLTRRQGVPAP